MCRKRLAAAAAGVCALPLSAESSEVSSRFSGRKMTLGCFHNAFVVGLCFVERCFLLLVLQPVPDVNTTLNRLFLRGGLQPLSILLLIVLTQ